MNNEREIRYSRDQQAFRATEAKTPAAAIETSIQDAEQVNEYLSEIHVDFQGNDTYNLLVNIRNDIDEEYGKAERFGEAFLDGGTVGLDIIYRFAPQLKTGLHTSILTHINKLNIAHFIHERTDHFITSEQHRRYVDAIVPGRHRAGSKLDNDELLLLNTISMAKYDEDSQYDALREGFNFVRKYARRANLDDFAVLGRQAFLQDHMNTAKTKYAEQYQALDDELRAFMESEGKA